jgi:hypothetical protein
MKNLIRDKSMLLFVAFPLAVVFGLMPLGFALGCRNGYSYLIGHSVIPCLALSALVAPCLLSWRKNKAKSLAVLTLWWLIFSLLYLAYLAAISFIFIWFVAPLAPAC